MAAVAAGPAAGDLNGDGALGLVVATRLGSAWTVVTLVSLGDGSFLPGRQVDVGTLTIRELALGDIDGDGRLDLSFQHVGFPDYDTVVAIGEDDGRFPTITRITDQDFPLGIDAADLNGDGAPDLAIPNRQSSNVAIYLGDGSGDFAYVGEYGASDNMRAIVRADLDGDGDQDVAVPDNFGVAILLGAGDGTLGPRTSSPAGSPSSSLAVGHVNQGWSTCRSRASVKTTSPSYSERAAVPSGPSNLIAAATWPCTADSASAISRTLSSLPPAPGRTSSTWATSTPTDVPTSLCLSSNAVAVLLGQDGGSFGAPLLLPSGLKSESLSVVDLDGDGAQDLVVVNRASLSFGTGGALAVHLGLGDGTFAPIEQFGVQSVNNAHSLRVDDFDLDGAPDIAVVEPGSAASLFPGNVLALMNLIGQ